jgi:hypothetical protein
VSRKPKVGRWEPSDGAEMNRQGVPLALTTYRLVSASERHFFAYLCTLADKEGVVTGVGQEVMTARFEIDRRTLSRWIGALTRLRMLRSVQPGYQERAVYTLRPPTAWITERMTGLASPEELEAQFGLPHRALGRRTSEAPNVPRECPIQMGQPTEGHFVPSSGTSDALK